MPIHNKLAALLLLIFVAPYSAQADLPLQEWHQSIPEEGKEYSILPTQITAQPKVVEFFSFYCGPCYQFVEKYPVTEAINVVLPEGEVVTKYHVSAMGPLGKELTEAWAIAIVTDKTHQVEKPLFEAVRNKTLKSTADIQKVFSSFGIDTETYEEIRQSLMVKGLVTRQNAAMDSFKVRATPTFYINGKYRINNASIAAPTVNDYVDNFARVVQILLTQ